MIPPQQPHTQTPTLTHTHSQAHIALKIPASCTFVIRVASHLLLDLCMSFPVKAKGQRERKKREKEGKIKAKFEDEESGITHMGVGGLSPHNLAIDKYGGPICSVSTHVTVCV